MAGETPDSDPLTFEEEFEVCIHSQDEDDEGSEVAGSNKKEKHSCSSLEHYTVEEFMNKHPGCFSMEYPIDIFEGVEHSVYKQELFTKESPMFSLSAKHNQGNTSENGLLLQHVDPLYNVPKSQKKENISQWYSPQQKLYEQQEENPALFVAEEGTSHKSMSCSFDKAGGAFDLQYKSRNSIESTFVKELSASEAVYETKQSDGCQYVVMKENILNAHDINSSRNLKISFTSTPVSEDDCFAEKKLSKSWEEMCHHKLYNKLHKVLKKRISPKKLFEKNHLQIRKDKSLKSTTQNVHHIYQSSPSHDIRKGFLEQQTTKQTSTPCSKFPPSLHHGSWRRRSAPPVLDIPCSPSSATASPTPAPLNTMEENLPYQATDDDWHVTWNENCVHENKNTDPTLIISENSEHEAWREKDPTSLEALNTSPFGALKRHSEDKKSISLSWRKATRRSLDWPPSNNTTSKAFTQLPKHLDVSPLSWRAAPKTSLDWPQNQPLSKLFQSKVKANFNDKELQLKSFAPGFIDTHCHLDFLFERMRHSGSYSKFREDTKDPFPVSYEGCVTIFCKPWTFNKINWWEDIIMEPEVWAAFGCHPHFVDQFGDAEEIYLQAALMNSKTVALGEIGLDYFKKSPSQLGIQKEVFRKQLRVALNVKKPVIIHCRDAHRDCMDIMKEILPLNYRIHLHCFTGTWKQAEEWLETFSGLFLGITNLINNHKDVRSFQLQMVVKKIPLHRLLLETDAPYFRPCFLQEAGQHSHPGMALYVAAQVAHLKGEQVQVVLAHARHNTNLMYGI